MKKVALLVLSSILLVACGGAKTVTVGVMSFNQPNGYTEEDYDYSDYYEDYKSYYKGENFDHRIIITADSPLSDKPYGYKTINEYTTFSKEVFEDSDVGSIEQIPCDMFEIEPLTISGYSAVIIKKAYYWVLDENDDYLYINATCAIDAPDHFYEIDYTYGTKKNHNEDYSEELPTFEKEYATFKNIVESVKIP